MVQESLEVICTLMKCKMGYQNNERPDDEKILWHDIRADLSDLSFEIEGSLISMQEKIKLRKAVEFIQNSFEELKEHQKKKI